MGMQDRDWYKDLQREREKTATKSKPPKDLQRLLDDIPTPKTASGWHWSLIAIFWALIISLLATVFKLTS